MPGFVRIGGAFAATAALAAAAAFFLDTGDYKLQSFTDTYQARNSGASSTCGTTLGIFGREPVSGKHPLFIYLHGTLGDHDGREGQAFVTEAAKSGMVAVSVTYDSATDFSVTGLNNNAACIYGSGANSAVSKMCARAHADCSKGIVVAGHSQGAGIATRAKNHDSRVEAAWVMGYAFAGDTGGSNGNPSASQDDSPDGDRALPDNRLRVNVGEAEVGSNQNFVDALNQRTGRTGCTLSTNDCLVSSGPGWYKIANSAVVDLSADHCYFQGESNCATGNVRLDANWTKTTTALWGLPANIDWLDSFVTE